MNITINITEPTKKVQEFQEYDLGQITTTLQELLNSSSITVDSNIIPILKVLSIDNISSSYLIKDISESLYNTSDYITGQDLTEEDLILISGGNQNSETEINTAFTNKIYSAIMNVAFDEVNPNFEIHLTGNLDLTVTGTTNGDLGLVNLYFSGTETATLNGFTDLIITGTNNMVPVYFIHDSDGLKWYQDEIGADIDTSVFPKYIIKDVTPSTTLTGTTAETIIKSYLIPLNSFSNQDILNIISSKVQKIGVAGICLYKIYINTTASLSGATQIAYKSVALSSLYFNISRSFILQGGLIKGMNGSQNAFVDEVETTTAMLSASFDTSIDNYIIITAQLGVGTDSIIQQNFIVTN